MQDIGRDKVDKASTNVIPCLGCPRRLRPKDYDHANLDDHTSSCDDDSNGYYYCKLVQAIEASPLFRGPNRPIV